jgi:putative DNA primase/helicase
MHHNEFQAAIADAGLGTPDVVADGEVHRFPTNEDKGCERSGWYVFHGDAGSFGDWRSGIKLNWSVRKRVTREERRALAETARKEKAARRQREREKHDEAAEKAQEFVACAAPAMWHPYLKEKRVLPLGIKQLKSHLLIPLTDIRGKIWNVQTIGKGGSKRFMKGGRKKGLFHQIGGPIEDRFYICEGWATGATVHMFLDPHTPVFVAFDAGNLKPVAQTLRREYPGIGITVACDNDAWKPVNTGLIKGREAARAIGAELIFPTWENVDASSRPTDFNDLYRLGGL